MTERQVSTSYVGPIDRIHWGLVIAGMFVALAILVFSGVLAFAVGFGPTYKASTHAGYESGTVIWGGVAAFIAFGLGAFLVSRWARMRNMSNAVLHGFLVWAVGIPVLVYGLGTGIGPMLGITRPEATGAGTVISAVEMPSGAQNPNPGQAITSESGLHPGHVNARAWWMLISIAAGFLGALAFAAVGARTTGPTEYGTTTTSTTVRP